ncbi:MAG: hypothetical protein GY708_10445 [Actinomycetia bacterium]|nr:hypothetical protein [Actinomycetes bacterium]MCP4962093.1 hypothetical protein [Actinomycetes bacterium]
MRAGRGAGSSLLLAREWGMADLEDRLAAAIEASFEPTWDRSLGEFTWGMGLDEPHPRGQFNAFLAAAEASGPGRWEGLSAAPLEKCPQVVDVDFPSVALSRAEWIDGSLHLRVEVLDESPNERTAFRIVGAEPRMWDILGPDGLTVEVTTSGLMVRMPRVSADIEFTEGSY